MSTSEEFDLNTATTAELERLTDSLVGEGERVGLNLVPFLVELYTRQPWGSSMTITEYFRDARGVGEDGFRLQRRPRQELVRRMATVVPEVPISHQALLAGCAIRTIEHDRKDLGVVNPVRSEAQRRAAQQRPGARPDEARTDRQPQVTEDWRRVLNRVLDARDEQELFEVWDMVKDRLSERAARRTRKAAA